MLVPRLMWSQQPGGGRRTEHTARCDPRFGHAHHTGEVLAEVRREFRLHAGAEDPYAIKYHLSDGRTRLKQLQEMIGMRQ